MEAKTGMWKEPWEDENRLDKDPFCCWPLAFWKQENKKANMTIITSVYHEAIKAWSRVWRKETSGLRIWESSGGTPDAMQWGCEEDGDACCSRIQENSWALARISCICSKKLEFQEIEEQQNGVFVQMLSMCPGQKPAKKQTPSMTGGVGLRLIIRAEAGGRRSVKDRCAPWPSFKEVGLWGGTTSGLSANSAGPTCKIEPKVDHILPPLLAPVLQTL